MIIMMIFRPKPTPLVPLRWQRIFTKPTLEPALKMVMMMIIDHVDDYDYGDKGSSTDCLQ